MHQQHSKAFTLVPFQMLMMHLVRPAYGPYISAVAPREPFEPLVNDDIVHNKISQAVCHDAEANSLQIPAVSISTEKDEQHTGNSEYDKEEIVLLKESRFNLVMVPVQVPEKAVHHISMRKPGNAFHDNEGSQENKYIINNIHFANLSVRSDQPFHSRCSHHDLTLGKARANQALYFLEWEESESVIASRLIKQKSITSLGSGSIGPS
jgi:hypothetical protein